MSKPILLLDETGRSIGYLSRQAAEREVLAGISDWHPTHRRVQRRPRPNPVGFSDAWRLRNSFGEYLVRDAKGDGKGRHEVVGIGYQAPIRVKQMNT